MRAGARSTLSASRMRLAQTGYAVNFLRNEESSSCPSRGTWTEISKWVSCLPEARTVTYLPRSPSAHLGTQVGGTNVCSRCFSSSFRRFLAVGLCGESKRCSIKPAIRCQKPAEWGPRVWLYLLGGGTGGALGWVIRSGNWGQKTGQLPHSLHLSALTSTPPAAGLRHEAAAATSSLRIWQSATATLPLCSPVCVLL